MMSYITSPQNIFLMVAMRRCADDDDDDDEDETAGDEYGMGRV